LTQLVAGFPTVVTVEEGSLAGGLTALVAEAIARENLDCRLHARGLSEPLSGAGGCTSYLRRRHGLDAGSLVDLVAGALSREAAA
jgi:transketolase